jgi:hypothetical protein
MLYEKPNGKISSQGGGAACLMSALTATAADTRLWAADRSMMKAAITAA